MDIRELSKESWTDTTSESSPSCKSLCGWIACGRASRREDPGGAGPSAELEARLRVQSPVRPRGERGSVGGRRTIRCSPAWRAALRGGAWCPLAVSAGSDCVRRRGWRMAVRSLADPVPEARPRIPGTVGRPRVQGWRCAHGVVGVLWPRWVP